MERNSKLDNIKCNIISKSWVFGVFFYIYPVDLFSQDIIGILFCLNKFIYFWNVIMLNANSLCVFLIFQVLTQVSTSI